MARVQYGAIITELKGKLNGQVFQQGNVAKVLRTKSYAKGTPTVARQAATKNVSVNSRAWASLSRAQQDAWNAWTANWPFTDKFGAAYIGSGYQVYLAVNIALTQMNLATITAPPAITACDDPGTLTLFLSNAVNYSLQWTISPATPNDIFIFASAPVSNGRNGRNLRTKLMAYEDYSAAAFKVFKSEYVAAYGLPAVGSIVWVTGYCRNQVFPRLSFPFTIRGVVAP